MKFVIVLNRLKSKVVTYEALLHIPEIQFKTDLEFIRFFVVTGKGIQTYLMFERITDHVAAIRYRAGEVNGEAFGQFTGYAGQLGGGAAPAPWLQAG